MVTEDRLKLENRITKVEDAVVVIQTDVHKILTNHLPHIQRRITWLIGIVLALAAIHDFDLIPLIKGIL